MEKTADQTNGSDKCKDHNETYNNFCMNCYMNLCAKCDMNNHHGHTFINLLDTLL